MAAEVYIGPFENLDGSKIRYPILLRGVGLWVTWSEDPGTAFSASNLSATPITGRNVTTDFTLLRRVGNRFFFQLQLHGREGQYRFSIPGNVFNGNAPASLDVWINTYNPIIRSDTWTMPADEVNSRTVDIVARSGRARISYWRKSGVSIEGIVNGVKYSSRDAIEELILPRSNENGGYTEGSSREFTIRINLPERSRGVLHVRIDAYSAPTHTNGDLRPRIGGFGPSRDAYSPVFRFDTTESSVPTLTRGVEATFATSHAENSEALLIDQVLDVREGRWTVKPIDELIWRGDERSLYNQIRILYGDGEEYYTENPQSVFQNGGHEFTMRAPLANQQTHWVRWLAQSMLERFSELQHVATLQLKTAFHLRLGQVIFLRGLPTDAISNVVQIISIEHLISEQQTRLTVRTLPRASQQTFTAPVFDTNVFTNGQTINLGVGQAYNARLIAFGNPTPTITACGAPAWMTVDSQGNISGTPSATGSDTVTFTATNGVAPNATFTLTFSAASSQLWGSAVWGTFTWS